MAQIKKIVDSYSEEIVKIVNSLDNEVGFRQAFEGNRGVGRTQLAKILSAIKTAYSIEEIKLFIRYQESKSRKGESWNASVGNSTLGATLCKKIDEVIILVNNKELNLNELIELKLRLGEKFFGYLYWKGTIYAQR